MAGPSAARTISHPERAVRATAASEVAAAIMMGPAALSTPIFVSPRRVLRVARTPGAVPGSAGLLGRAAFVVVSGVCACAGGADAGIGAGAEFVLSAHR